MVKVESMAELFQRGGVQAYASLRLLAAGRGEVREDVGKLGDPVQDNLVSSADGFTRTRRSPSCISRGSSLAVITAPYGGLSLALISLDLCHLDSVSRC